MVPNQEATDNCYHRMFHCQEDQEKSLRTPVGPKIRALRASELVEHWDAVSYEMQLRHRQASVLHGKEGQLNAAKPPGTLGAGQALVYRAKTRVDLRTCVATGKA